MHPNNKYVNTWNLLKRDGHATFTVTDPAFEKVFQGLKDVKKVENRHRKAVGLTPFTKLVVVKSRLNQHYIKVDVTFYQYKRPDVPELL